ncbi:MAG: transporter substrate-binding domain-containing protein [Solobacterium sp.]|nr:transporter substrate-binding domain-containing protein [Solobacterium sp.]
MKTNKIMKSALAAMMALSLTACSGGSGSGGSGTNNKTGKNSTYAYLLDTTDLKKPELDLSKADGVLKKVLDNGFLCIGTSPDYPAAEWITDDGTIYGSEMMLAKYVADSLGVDLKIETMDFGSTFAAVDTGKVDCAFSGYGWKKDREEAYEITIGYIGEQDDDDEAYHTVIVAAKDADKYKSFSDFIGTHILAQVNSLQEMYAQDQIVALDPNGGTNLEQVGTLDQAILGLASGKCDAVALDGTTAENYVKQSDGKFALTGLKFDLSIYGDYEGNIGIVKKGEKSMIEALNTIIQLVKDEGYYEKWYAEAKAAAGVED